MRFESSDLEPRDFYVCSSEDNNLPELYLKVPALRKVHYDLNELYQLGMVVFEAKSLLPILSYNSQETIEFISEAIYQVMGTDVTILDDTVEQTVYSSDTAYITIDVIDEFGQRLKFTYITFYPVICSQLNAGDRGILRKQ